MCNECNGNYNNCPVCGEDNAKAIECEECEGKGFIYLEDSDELGVPEKELCMHCEGEGVIYVDI